MGLEIFDDYIKIKNHPYYRTLQEIEQHLEVTKLSKYSQALNSYVVFEESNHSYIAAYMTTNDASGFGSPYSILSAIAQSQSRDRVEGSRVNQRERFIQIF